MNLEGANLEEANLGGTNLRETNLKWTKLKGINLKEANLQEANLEGANFEATLLEWAYGLSLDQLSKVKTLYDTKWDEKLLIQLKEKHPVLFEEPNEWADIIKISNLLYHFFYCLITNT